MLIPKILNKFNTQDRPKLQHLLDYYEGRQKILQKQATDTGKPCNRVVVNYCDCIVHNYLGYLAGKPITYDNDNFDEVKDIFVDSVKKPYSTMLKYQEKDVTMRYKSVMGTADVELLEGEEKQKEFKNIVKLWLKTFQI